MVIITRCEIDDTLIKLAVISLALSRTIVCQRAQELIHAVGGPLDLLQHTRLEINGTQVKHRAVAR